MPEKLQGVVRDAQYKEKYEQTVKKLQLQQIEFDRKIREKIEELEIKESELQQIIERNTTVVNQVTNSQAVNIEGKFTIE